VEEEDRGQPGVMTSNNGHNRLSTEEALQLTKGRGAWRSVVHHVANVCTSEYGTNDDDDDKGFMHSDIWSP